LTLMPSAAGFYNLTFAVTEGGGTYYGAAIIKVGSSSVD